MVVDLAQIANIAFATAATGMAGVVWRTAVLQARTAAQLEAHTKNDDQLFALCLSELRELRENQNGLRRAQNGTHQG